MKKSTALKMAAMVLSLGLVTGCASTSEMQAQIAKAQETADAAMARADAAASKADAAMKAAIAAQAAADDCAERCDRMMQKAMAK
ncbi:MAG: hypothetical protein G8D58_01955 [gamma proteobacterium symbiont of Phacoides pectinatus]